MGKVVSSFCKINPYVAKVLFMKDTPVYQSKNNGELNLVEREEEFVDFLGVKSFFIEIKIERVETEKAKELFNKANTPVYGLYYNDSAGVYLAEEISLDLEFEVRTFEGYGVEVEKEKPKVNEKTTYVVTQERHNDVAEQMFDVFVNYVAEVVDELVLIDWESFSEALEKFTNEILDEFGVEIKVREGYEIYRVHNGNEVYQDLVPPEQLAETIEALLFREGKYRIYLEDRVLEISNKQ